MFESADWSCVTLPPALLDGRIADGAHAAVAGGERGSRAFEVTMLMSRCVEGARRHRDAPRDPCGVLERRHGLAEIVERGAVVFVKRSA